MSITWIEIKKATLKKMFAMNGNTIPTDNSTADYLAAMPETANEGLQRLSTIGKFIRKSVDIAHSPVETLLTDETNIYTIEGGSHEFEASRAHSFYFEYLGKSITCEVYVDGTLADTYTLDNATGFKSFKKLVNNDNDKVVKVKILSDYPFTVKNRALYKARFYSESEIQPFSKKIRYDLKELVDDFYELGNNDIIFETTDYSATSEYNLEGDSILVVDREAKGNFKVWYNAYPTKITTETVDSYILDIDDEIAVLLPTYMASELYKDDDVSIATQYRNQFEISLAEIKEKVRRKAPSSERFVSKGGWY